jgi:hypothetical protein
MTEFTILILMMKVVWLTTVGLANVELTALELVTVGPVTVELTTFKPVTQVKLNG